MTTSTAPAALLDFQQNLQQTTETTDTATLSRVNKVAIDAMTWAELNDYVDTGARRIAANFASISQTITALKPAIERARAALSCQGRRTDLLDAPSGLTFTEWLNSKRDILGSRTTVYRQLGLGSQKLLSAGTMVRDIGGGEVGEVVSTHTDADGTLQAEVSFKDGDGETKTTVSGENLEKVPVWKISIGDFAVFTDDTPGYRRPYTGNQKFGPREKIPQKPQKPKPARKPKPKRLALVRRSGGVA
jgi:hypothetical protein